MKAKKSMPDLFKKNKPVFRKFKDIEGQDAGDTPYLWDAYKSGCLDHFPKDLNMGKFLELMAIIFSRFQEHMIVEDYVDGKLVPIALLVAVNNGWLLEPHVQYFSNASKRCKLRTYVAFTKRTKYRKDIGACLYRVPHDTMIMTNRLEQYGLIEYVGKIYNGQPTGNEYLYSTKCKRRSVRSK